MSVIGDLKFKLASAKVDHMTGFNSYLAMMENIEKKRKKKGDVRYYENLLMDIGIKNREKEREMVEINSLIYEWQKENREIPEYEGLWSQY